MRAERDGEDGDDRWVLHASDRTLLGNKTGATRLGFAILLKMFQANGRFPYRLEEVPVAAVEAIASQIEVPAEAWRGYDWRSRAAAYHRAQIAGLAGGGLGNRDRGRVLSFGDGVPLRGRWAGVAGRAGRRRGGTAISRTIGTR